jgi:hypothetical protein
MSRCAVCGRDFKQPGGDGRPRRYCSERCRQDARNERRHVWDEDTPIDCERPLPPTDDDCYVCYEPLHGDENGQVHLGRCMRQWDREGDAWFARASKNDIPRQRPWSEDDPAVLEARAEVRGRAPLRRS